MGLTELGTPSGTPAAANTESTGALHLPHATETWPGKRPPSIRHILIKVTEGIEAGNLCCWLDTVFIFPVWGPLIIPDSARGWGVGGWRSGLAHRHPFRAVTARVCGSPSRHTPPWAINCCKGKRTNGAFCCETVHGELMEKVKSSHPNWNVKEICWKVMTEMK